MKISPISYSAYNVKNANVQKSPVAFGEVHGACNSYVTRLKGVNNQTLEIKDKNDIFTVENISDEKVGSKFLLRPTDPEFKDLTILFTPKSYLKSEVNDLSVSFNNSLSFKGQVWGSIRKYDDSSSDETMKKAYSDFWKTGMHDVASYIYRNENSKDVKDDYNFFIPSDGDGTRYRDITKLQGGVTKPASKIPATLNGHEMRLVQGILTNFSKTGKVEADGFNFVEVEPAMGSAYAFLEGLASGQIPTSKPIVFSWGDNFSDIDITKLMQYHEKNNAGMTILTLPVDTERIVSLGAVKVKDADNLEMIDFFEKPKDKDLIQSFVIPGTEDKCLGAVGPYVLSAEALEWLKENYVKNPDNFKDHEGKVDFSRKVVGQLLPLMASGEIKDKNGNALRMMAYEKPETDTWSDLGSEKDFTNEMKNVKLGYFYNMPDEMRQSISENVDRYGNITFNQKDKALLNRFLDKYDIDLRNAIICSK
ncbi:MAG: hypothetical protein E7Z91_02700 [Cyanobacteria bacterium SIG30]|nr:hypothetical protein [Cyanobacteria bacterium SIG30]